MTNEKKTTIMVTGLVAICAAGCALAGYSYSKLDKKAEQILENPAVKEAWETILENS